MASSQPCITQFLTDGSLIRLCDAAQRVLGVPVSLRDASGRTIVQGDGRRVWSIGDGADGEAGVDSTVATAAEDGGFGAPLRISTGKLGTLWAQETEAADPDHQEAVESFLTHLASTVSEVCEGQIQLSRRVDELGVLYRLSSMLVGATSVDAVVEAALRSVVEVLEVDAGTVRILDEEDRMLQLRASVGLSEPYIRAAGSLPADQMCDAAALSGEVYIVEDISQEPSLLHAHELLAEGVRAMASVGLAFRGRSLGLLRLYSRNAADLKAVDRDLLQSVAQQVAAAVANARLLETEADALRVQRQLDLASDIQRRMLPGALTCAGGLDIAARYDACFELGGDFYDVFSLDGKMGVVLGDVVGKGVPAALLMSAVRATIRAHSHSITTVDDIMALTNVALCRDTREEEFATVFLGAVDPETLRFTYCNAGHEPAVVLRVPEHRAPTSADLDELTTGGMVLGVDPSQRYQRASCDLHPGDVVMIHSDGLSDAMNFDQERFGQQRVRQALLDALAENPDAGAERIAAHLLWEVRRFAGLNTQTDDQTIVVIRVPRDAPCE